jgi:hypothetical protein
MSHMSKHRVAADTPRVVPAVLAMAAGVALLLTAQPALAGIVTSAGGNYGIARSMMPRGGTDSDPGQAPAHRRHKPQSRHHHGSKTHRSHT